MYQREEPVILRLFDKYTLPFFSFRNLMVDWNTDYLAAGGNRHPSAADWDLASGLLAFGADRNVALWSPLVRLISNRQIKIAHYADRMMATKASRHCCMVTPIS